MPTTDKRRADARRRAWGRGPMILRFEPLEGRHLLSTTATPLPDLVGTSFTTPQSLNWGDSFDAKGVVTNQGSAPVTGAFQVEIYASTTPGFSSSAVMLGEATIPAGLQPGAQASFDDSVSLPADPLTTTGSVYIGMAIDPTHTVSESNTLNNSGVGAGFDLSLVTIKAAQTASLVGTSLTVSGSQNTWGGSLQITQQISNTGTGDAPATRALVVLTPSSTAAGGTSDMTIANLSVPPIPAGQSVTVTQNLTLPSVPPALLASSTQFTLSIVQDADYKTNVLYPHSATQGDGADSAQVVINSSATGDTASTAMPTLAVTSVKTDTTNIKWGQNFQVDTTIENTGTVDPGPFRVRFLLVGSNGAITNSLFLGDATVASLAPQTGSEFIHTLQLPSTLPAGDSLASGTARIAVIVDPEQTLSQSSRANSVGYSAPITLQIIGTNGTTTPVTTPPTTTKPSTTNVSAAKTAAQRAAAAKAARAAAKAAAKSRPKTINHTTTTILKHDLKVFPKNVTNFFRRAFK